MKTGMPISVSYSLSGPALIIVILFAVLILGGLVFFIYKKLMIKKIDPNFKPEEIPVQEVETNVVQPAPIDNQQYDAPTFDNQYTQAPMPDAAPVVEPQTMMGAQPMPDAAPVVEPQTMMGTQPMPDAAPVVESQPMMGSQPMPNAAPVAGVDQTQTNTENSNY